MSKNQSWMARLLVISLLAGAIPAAAQAQTEQGISLSLNGGPVRFSVEPQLVNSTLMVPLRDVSTALGVTVEWEQAAKTATAVKGERSIQLTVGSTTAYRGDTAVTLAEAPVTVQDKLLVPLRFFSESFDFNVYWDGANRAVSIVDADKSLPTVGSAARLQELLKESGFGTDSGSGFAATGAVAEKAMSSAAAAAPAAAAQAKSADAAGGAGYSGTNVQVEGVDEADIIKTDGQYIYQVNRDRVIVTSAVPADNMSVVGTVYVDDRNFYPRELYVDDRHLVVIGTTFHPQSGEPVQPEPMPLLGDKPAVSANPSAAVDSGSSASVERMPVVAPAGGELKKIAVRPNPGRSTTKTIVYDLADRSSLRPVRETELEGNYISSRKIGDALYVITNKYMNSFQLMRPNGAEAGAGTDASLPAYRDSNAGTNFQTIGLEDVRYFPKAVKPNYLLIGGLNLGEPGKNMQVTSYLGSGQHVYASASNLYIGVNEYEAAPEGPVALAAPADEQADRSMPPSWTPPETQTVIYKFGLNQGTVHYEGRGKVPGHPLNQFSMDEHNGFFRIATTSGAMWRNDEFTSKNNVYVLDASMQTVGKLEDLAPGERIYSVRYAGDRAYMVTFRNVDPLFVIDLKEPAAPAVLGKLKIPGYSDYLHPYDENHLIGFGKETVEVANKGAGGPGEETMAYYQGMKIAMFDVSDVNNPKELFKETIGDRGTHSDLLHNHKALLFSREKQLMAFPVTVMEVPNNKAADPTAYGEFAFQGAYVYGIDLQQGFQLRGKITHLTDDDLKKSGSGWYDGSRNVERLLYIGDILYSASPDAVKANRLSDLQEVGSVTLPPWTPKQP